MFTHAIHGCQQHSIHKVSVYPWKNKIHGHRAKGEGEDVEERQGREGRSRIELVLQHHGVEAECS
jgi:hypothetical protein